MGIAIGRLDQFVGNAILLAAALVVLAAHETFDRENGVLRVGDGLTLGGLAHKALTALGEGNHGRGGTGTFGVFQNYRLPTFHDGHAGVGRSQIDS